MNFEFQKTRSRKAAFTIIELLVAVSVTALLVSLMLTIVVNVMGGWSRSSGTLTSGNQARLVLDQISRDLQAAVIKRDTNVWFAATLQTSQTGSGDATITGANWTASKKGSGTATNATASTGSTYIPAVTTPAASLEDYRFGQGGVWLRMITSVPDTNADTEHLSAPRAVAYQISRLPVVSGSTEVRYQLFRSEVRPDATFTAGYNLFSAAYDTTTITPKIDDPYAIRRPSLDHVIANNVVDFGVRVWARNSTTNALEIVFPKPSGAGSGGVAATTSTTVIPVSGSVSSASISYSYPEVVEVFVRVLTDEGVTMLGNFENPPSGYTPPADQTWWDIVLANSRVYTRRIEINSKGL